jgi:hypothetical protein
MPASIVTEGEDDAAAAKAGRRAIESNFMAIAKVQRFGNDVADIL